MAIFNADASGERVGGLGAAGVYLQIYVSIFWGVIIYFFEAMLTPPPGPCHNK